MGPFYPSGFPKEAFLEYYATCFCTTEINNSFYRLPEKKRSFGGETRFLKASSSRSRPHATSPT